MQRRTQAAIANARSANDAVERDEATPRRRLHRGVWTTLVLVRREGAWRCVAWFENGPAVSVELRDPSGVGEVRSSDRVRVAARSAPPWVVRAFEALRVVGERDGAPVVELDVEGRAA